jgi:hypothetical protein
MHLRSRPLLVIHAVLGFAGSAGAIDFDLPGDLPPLAIHGFISQGYLLTNSNDYLAAETTRGSFEFSEVGLNFTLPATDKLRLGIQLFSGDLGPTGDYRAKLDWYYLDYHWKDWLGVRAGRVKLPFGLYNDTSDIDAARTAVLLPQSIYPAQDRNFLLAQTGVELYGWVGLGGAGALDYRIYAGTIFLDLTQGGSPSVVNLTVPYVAGGRLMWNTPVDGLRIGGSLQFLRIDTDLLLPQGTLVSLRVPATLAVASLEYSANEWLFAVEYSRWLIKVRSNDSQVVPESSGTSERGYLLGSYRFNPLLQAGAYYSIYFPDTGDREGPGEQQHDVAATLRFDINRYWLIKLEAHYLHGTASLSSSLNGNLPLADLAPNWALFAVKTTAYF